MARPHPSQSRGLCALGNRTHSCYPVCPFRFYSILTKLVSASSSGLKGLFSSRHSPSSWGGRWLCLFCTRLSIQRAGATGQRWVGSVQVIATFLLTRPKGYT